MPFKLLIISLFFILLNTNPVLGQLDTVWTEKGEILLGEILEQHEDNGKINYILKQSSNKTSKIKTSNVKAFYRTVSKEKYIRVPLNGKSGRWYNTEISQYLTNGFKNYVFFREICGNSDGLKVLWCKYYKSGSKIIIVPLGNTMTIFSISESGSYESGGFQEGYFIQKKDTIILFEDKYSDKIFKILSGDCQSIQSKFEKAEYKSSDLIKFVKDYNFALSKGACN